MKFTFLHTIDSNIALFANPLRDAGLEVNDHQVRADLLAEVTKRGGIDAEIQIEIAEALTKYAEGNDLLLLSCSSLSTVADQLKSEGVAVERTDRLLAEAVYRQMLASDPQGRLAVLVVAPTTQTPTGALFEAVRLEMGGEQIETDVILLPKVWDLFLKGDTDAYQTSLTRAIDDFLASSAHYEHVALGQASMAPALLGCQSKEAEKIWTVPGATCSYLSEKMGSK